MVSDKFVFDMEKIEFNIYEQAFYIKFNNKLDTTTVDRKDFKLKYQKRAGVSTHAFHETS